MLAFPYEAVTIYGTVSVASSSINTTLLEINEAAGEQYTVLYARIYSDLNVSNVNILLHCDQATNPFLRQTSRSVSASMPIEKQSEVWGKIVCSDDMVMRSTGSTFTSDVNYAVTYLPNGVQYPVISYMDWLLPTMIVIFLLSFSVFGFFFTPWRKK